MMPSFVPNVRPKRRRKIRPSTDVQEQIWGLKWTGIGILICVFIIHRVSYDDGNDRIGVLEFQNEPSVPKWTCQWMPDSHDECNELLAQRLPPPKPSYPEHEENPGPRKQRWLFFGDSTMKRQFTSSNLDRHLVGEPIHFIKNRENNMVDPCWTSIDCEVRESDRCGMAEVFGFKRAKTWKKPQLFPNFEGPVNYGLDHPDCSDCGGCGTHFLHCSRNKASDPDDILLCTKPKLAYGGFMKIEFAKDVELQTEHYKTTQENTAMYLREHFNKPYLVKEWGKPVCVILTGFHDMILLIKTKHFKLERFLQNVEWYLNVMKPECSHFIWLTNTAPSFENPKNWPQTVEVVKDWNDGVKSMIGQNHFLRQMTTIVDVYTSSLEIPKKDHIHLIGELIHHAIHLYSYYVCTQQWTKKMINETLTVMIDNWYNHVGHFFSALITERPINEV